MRKFTKHLSLLLVMSMAFSVMACDTDSDTEGQTSTTAPATTTEAKEETTTSEEDETDAPTEDETEEPTEEPTDEETEEPTDEETDPPANDDTGGLQLPLTEEDVAIEIYVGTSVTDMESKLFDQILEERTGLTINWQTFPLESYGEKIKSILGTGVAPDIHAGGPLSHAEINDFGEQGAFAKINEHYDILPNFTALYLDNEENSWFPYSYGSDAGNLYVWPMYGRTRDVNHGFMYRADIFREEGIEPWTNQDEFYDALVALKEAYPESYPIVSKYKEVVFQEWAVYWGIGNSSHYPFHYDETDSNSWRYFGTDPKYLEMLDFMKKLYDEGLLDPEFLTDDLDPWSEKITNDRGFIFYDWIGRMPLFNTQMREVNEDWDLRYASPVGPTGEFKAISKILSWGPVVGNNDKSALALQVLDYLTSPEGAIINTIGVEGVNFEWDGDVPVYPELEDAALIDIGLLEEEYGMWLQGLYVRADQRSSYFNFSEEEQEAQDMIVNDDLFMDLEPEIKLTDEETGILADIRTQLVDELTSFSANYVMSDASYDEFVARIEGLNISQYEDILNAAQERLESDIN